MTDFSRSGRLGRLVAVGKAIGDLAGPAVAKLIQPAQQSPPFVADQADLSEATLGALRAEAWRLGELIGLDANRQRQL